MEKIRLSKSIVGSSEKEAVTKVIDEGYLGMGSFVRQFEADLKNYLGAKFVMCVNTGTSALHLALMALGLKPEDEILVQSLTFIATFQAISASGANAVPCEVLPDTLTIDLKDAKRKITEKTKVIMPVHYGGRVNNLDEIYDFAKKYNLRVIEDAAHAFGTRYNDKIIGSFGDIICFSFDGIKNITSGEGGAVVTSDEKIAKYVKDARLLGVKEDTEKRYKSERSWEFDVTHQGYRYHMSNLFAAIGIVQLKRFEKEFKIARQKLAKRYNEKLKNIKGIILFYDDYSKTVPHIFSIRVINKKRDILRQQLIYNNIECGIHYYPNHLLSFYGAQKGKLPLTEKIYEELISLPLHPGLSEKDQDRVIDCIKEVMSC